MSGADGWLIGMPTLIGCTAGCFWQLYGRRLSPLPAKYIIIGISALLALVVEKHFLIWAAFAACFLIFVFPLLILGTVTPSLAKYVMDNLEDNGKNIGNLGALNTIGSIIGTFVPTFITIPAVGTAVTF